MKKFIIIWLIQIGYLANAQTSEQLSIIKKNADSYFKENLNDYNSYEPMSWDDFKSYPKDTSKLNALRPNIIRYDILHKFRAKNENGGTVIYTYKFTFDENLNVLNGFDWIIARKEYEKFLESIKKH